MVDRTLSHYRIVERLGAGGMGEVYRAHDEKLDRDVALKVLPEGALADEASRSRFRKEARALSRLSHPHIATIHDFDSEDGIDFLVMELVTGPSVEEALRSGPLPEKDVLRLGAQLARGLQAAHEQGVVHRDLKPANLALTPDGFLKILDFGLARLVEPRPASPGHTTATETAGVVAGSPPYMAPEQLLGKPPDARTDLYSAGVVLYELATGRRPFGSRSGVALTDAILHEVPPAPRSTNAALSPGLEAVLLKALDKDRELRHQTAKDLLVDLERLQLRSDAAQVPAGSPGEYGRRPRTWSRLGWIAVAVALIGVPAGGVWIFRPLPPPRVTGIRPLTLDLGRAFPQWYSPTWATDGSRIFYVVQKEGRSALYQAAISGGEALEIPTPFHSGLELYGYLRRRSALVVLADPAGRPSGTVPVWLLPIPKGVPIRLGDLRANEVAVSPEEERLALSVYGSRFENGRVELVRIDEPLDPPLVLPVPGLLRGALAWSPDGRRIRFTARGSLDADSRAWIWEMAAAGGPPRPLWWGRDGSWTGDGRYFVFRRDAPTPANSPGRSDIYAARAARWPFSTQPEFFQLTAGPQEFSDFRPRGDGRGLIAFGRDSRPELWRFDRGRKLFEPFQGGKPIGMVQPSPDRAWIAWIRLPDLTLWKSRPDGSEPLALTTP
jgi:hypothetical protein